LTSVRQGADVPIVARQSGHRVTAASRSGRAAPNGDWMPPGDLLPSGRLRDHPRDAGPWGEPAFAREVDAIRCQLAPIRSRLSLASSFEREAGALAAALVRSRTGAGRFYAVRAAYAVRWAELGDGRQRPPWSAFVTEPG
jgi:hypothetical protein